MLVAAERNALESGVIPSPSARSLLLLSLLLATCAASAEPEFLTTARAIRDLSPEAAQARQPVRLKATVTLGAPDRTIFLQDITGGTFIRSRPDNPLLHSGQLVEVEGATYPGLYVPGIDPKRINVLGEAELPSPAALTYEQLTSGQFHYQWTEVSGIVRRISTSEARTIITLALGDGRIDLLVPTDSGPSLPLVDARVRVVGLAAGSINDRRQLVAPHLRMRSFDDLTVIEAAPADPYEIAITPSQELLRFAPNGRVGHRVKVHGVVTHAGTETLFLRDGTQGLRVHGVVPTEIVPGSEVEVLGFAEMGRFTAFLNDAESRVVGKLDAPVPLDTTPKAVLAGTFEADLIRLEGTVLDAVRTEGTATLVMQAGETVFSARLPQNGQRETAPLPGSVLQLVGVCSIAQAELQPQGFRSAPRSFELLLRSADDIRILRTTTWWTAKRLAVASTALLAMVVTAAGWVMLLRRQVRRQTSIIQEKVQTETVMEERQRIAREFHDTLEQELVGLSLRLDALATRVADGKPRDLLDTARRLLQRLQNEARGFVWDLRRTSAGSDGLVGQIRHALASLVDTGRLRIDVHAAGSVRPLPGIMEHNLVRIAQEAATNAIKHGSASEVLIETMFEEQEVRLSIRDNGCGFNPEDCEREGHFGIVGMRERARKLGGSFSITSEPNAGARVEITVPTSQPA